MSKLAGVALCLAIAIAATFLGRLAPVVGAPVIAILVGAAIAVVRRPGAALAPGIRFSSRTLLQASIVLLGTSLDLAHVVAESVRSLPLMLGTMALCLTAAFALGEWLGLRGPLTTFIGCGTAICGASAIAALSTVVETTESDVAFSISTIFLFNVAAVLAFPPIGHALALSQHAFGVWAGTAINDTSSVVAAGYVYGASAGAQAVIVKLTRATLIVPIVAFFAYRRVMAHRAASSAAVPWGSIIPWFIVYFVLAAIGDTIHAIPSGLHAPLNDLAIFLIVTALAGVGLSTDVAKIRLAGLRPVVLGAALWVLVAVSSLVIQHVTGID